MVLQVFLTMPHVYTHGEYADMIFVYGFCDGNALGACREYRRRFPGRRVPDSRVFTCAYSKLRETGAVPSRHISSERGDEQTVDDVENILQVVEESPATSTRRISTRVGIPQTRVWRTLRQHGLYLYHLQRVQHLEAGDDVKRLEFCRWVNANRALIPFILFTDEATFTRNGINNTHNAHRWSEENPHAIVDSNFQYRFSVNVWCGVIDNQLIGPVVLPNRLTGAMYADFLENVFPPLLDDVPLATRMRMFFQHDGAPAHVTRQVTQYLNTIFPDRWIGRSGPVQWPPRSPDLTPLDYCLWGWMKTEVYNIQVNTREELVARIMNIGAIIKEDRDKIRNATRTIGRRVGKCMEAGGETFEQLL